MHAGPRAITPSVEWAVERNTRLVPTCQPARDLACELAIRRPGHRRDDPVDGVIAMASVYQRGVAKTWTPDDRGGPPRGHRINAVAPPARRRARRCARRERRPPRPAGRGTWSLNRRICVAHAGSDTSTVSAPSSSRTGRTWAAMVAPTISAQRPNTPPTARPDGPGPPPRSERTSPSITSLIGRGSSALTRSVSRRSTVGLLANAVATFLCHSLERELWHMRRCQSLTPRPCPVRCG